MARPCGRFVRMRLVIPAVLIAICLVLYYMHNLQAVNSEVSNVDRSVTTSAGDTAMNKKTIHKMLADFKREEDIHKIKQKDLIKLKVPLNPSDVKQDSHVGNKKTDRRKAEEKQGLGRAVRVDSKQLSGKIAGVAPKERPKSKLKPVAKAAGDQPKKLLNAKKQTNVKSPPLQHKTLQREKNIVQNTQHRAANNMIASEKNDPDLACKIPELMPFDESVKHLIDVPVKLRCNGTTLTYMKSDKFFIDQAVAGSTEFTTCFYSYLERENDDVTRITDPVKVRLAKNNFQLNFKVSSDFTIVGCQRGPQQGELNVIAEDDPSMHVDLHAHIVEKPSVIENSLKYLRQNKGVNLNLNVIMLGIDSTSRMNFVRQMPKSNKALFGMGAVTLSGYNIVGDATTGALIPLLTGKHEFELPDVRREAHTGKYLDSYNFIWDKFALHGYVTMFAEDEPKISAFNLRLNGFDRQPTDHYMRTFWQEAEVKGLCLGPKPVHQVMLDYTADFMKSYPTLPKLGLTFFTGLTHSNINKIKLMDDALVSFLDTAKKSGAVNNTMFILFSDHGARYTSIRATMQGKLEERLPYLSIVLPKWVKDKHPVLYTNLMKNYNRLTTPFDIHETLRSVVDHKTHKVTSKQQGISLFNEIPKGRMCSDAGVNPHWCSCLQWQSVPIGNLTGLAKSLLSSINDLSKPHRSLCTQLSFLRIVKAERLQPTVELLKFLGTSDVDQRDPLFHDKHTVEIHSIPLYYRLTVEAMPGRSLFEGTMKVHPGLSDTFVLYELSSPISRINRYGFTASCVEKVNPDVAKYCFCKEYVGMPVAFMGASVQKEKVISQSV